MTATLNAVQPGNIEFRMCVTMTLDQWHELYDVLNVRSRESGDPPLGVSFFESAIMDLICTAEQTFRPNPTTEQLLRGVGVNEKTIEENVKNP